MAPITSNQARTRERFEGLIRLLAPALDLVLAAGERLSRLVEPEDLEYYPPRTNAAPPPSDAHPEDRTEA